MDHENRSRHSSHLERDDAGENSERGETEPQNSAKLLGGRIACLVGILLSAASILAPVLGASANISGGVLGVVLGALGYFLGSRRLGSATVVLGVVALFLAVLLSEAGWL